MTSAMRVALQDWYAAVHLAKLDRRQWDRDFIRDRVTRLVRVRRQPWTGGHLGWYFSSKTLRVEDEQARVEKAWRGIA